MTESDKRMVGPGPAEDARREARRVAGHFASVVRVAAACAACLLLAACPAIRHGASGQLEQAQAQAQSAGRTAVLAIDLYSSRKATSQLAAVQIEGARDEANKTYKKVSSLTAGDDRELDMQRALTLAIGHCVSAMNLAGAVVRGIDTSATLGQARQEVVAAVTEISKATPQ